MPRTLDSFPGDRIDSGVILDNQPDTGSIGEESGSIYYVSGAFLMSDSLGPFNPRSIFSGSGIGADREASFVLLNNTASLPNERALTGSNFVEITDNGPGNTVEVGLRIPSTVGTIVHAATTASFVESLPLTSRTGYVLTSRLGYIVVSSSF